MPLMMARARQRANTEGATGFVSDFELGDLINEGIAELWDLIRSAYGQDYFLSSAPFNTVPNQETYSLATLAADFLAFRGLDVIYGTNLVETARPFMFNERNRYKWTAGWAYTLPVYYRLEGSNLVLMPKPNGIYACKLWYTPTSPIINYADTTTTFDGIAGWEEYAILWAAIRMLRKEGNSEDAGNLQQDMAAIKSRIDIMAAGRDADNPERVIDITRSDWLAGRY